ncbi:hypothetical protein ACP26L_04340 [Paenibacillus sp. S-38]|uniref:hypothetical protein n=1 Tax=Paenibacillus sp. S-38 TaxID=3416710 RepID=UPI003CF9BFAA
MQSRNQLSRVHFISRVHIDGQLSSLFITVLVLAIFTQGLSSLTTVSRLLFVMGRDTTLPRRFFGSLHPRFQTRSPTLSWCPWSLCWPW